MLKLIITNDLIKLLNGKRFRVFLAPFIYIKPFMMTINIYDMMVVRSYYCDLMRIERVAIKLHLILIRVDIIYLNVHGKYFPIHFPGFYKKLLKAFFTQYIYILN